MCFCTKNKGLEVPFFVSFFFFTLGSGFNRKEVIFIFSPFVSAFKFFEKKCMGIHGVNHDLVPFVETFFSQCLLNIASLQSLSMRELI